MFLLCRHLKRIRKTQRKAKDLHSPTNYPGSTQTDPGSKCPTSKLYPRDNLLHLPGSGPIWIQSPLKPTILQHHVVINQSSNRKEFDEDPLLGNQKHNKGKDWKSQKKLKNTKFLQDVFQLRMPPDEGGVSRPHEPTGSPLEKTPFQGMEDGMEA